MRPWSRMQRAMLPTHTMASSMAGLQMFEVQKVGGIWKVDRLDASNRHNPLYHGSLVVVVVIVVLHIQTTRRRID